MFALRVTAYLYSEDVFLLYIYCFQNGQSDIYIHGMKHRNRALNGDVVVVLPSPKDQWKVD